MLRQTFLHLPRIGAKSEQRLWRAGILTWDDFDLHVRGSPSLFGDDFERNRTLDESRLAWEQGDAQYFAQRLPRAEHYRIALSFPSETAFLDIETTGLSLYYNSITVVGLSLNNTYHAFVDGDPPEHVLSLIESAKCLVTFNGSLFDLPFLRKHFKNIRLPLAHVDLRFMCRKAGLSGGQKAIERVLGIDRPSSVTDLSGIDAVELWSNYRNGDLYSLYRLLTYNHSDIEGMKFLFKESLARLVHSRLKHGEASNLLASSSAAPTEDITSNRPYTGPVYPLVRMDMLRTRSLKSPLLDQRQPIIVGLDLTGSESKATGVCVLNGRDAVTSRVFKDSQLIDLVLSADPDLVSIDSPLSLPKGRSTAFDDDPSRWEFGILRECERMLKKRGVNVYPSLINSMQKMTHRGIQLAQRLRALGIPVIESYPGAAQDIMGIVRKRKGLDRLTSGLVDFGINGAFASNAVSHDELDAITSAVVGAFFLDGRFEALGNAEEEYLIIPDLNGPPDRWSGQIVVGLSGPISAGKTTLARHLELRGFSYSRYSEVLEAKLRSDGLPVCREELQRLGEWVNASGGQRWLGHQVLSRVSRSSLVVVDGLRFPEDHAFWSEMAGPSFLHLYVDSDFKVREARYAAQNPGSDFAMISSQPVERSTLEMRNYAHDVISNNESIASAQSELDRIVKYMIGHVDGADYL